MAGKDIVTIDEPISSAQVVAYMKDPSSIDLTVFVEDPDAVAARIMRQTLDANSAEALFGEPETWKAEDHIGEPLQFHSVAWLPSERAESGGFPIFGVFSVADLSGETHVLTCGAKSVVQKQAKADAEGWLPRWLSIVKAEKPTRAGYYPLDVVAAKVTEDGDGEPF